MRQQPKLGSPEREKRKNFPKKGSNGQPGLLTEQRIERIPKESWPAADRSLPAARGREADVQKPELEGNGLLQSRSQRLGFYIKL